LILRYSRSKRLDPRLLPGEGEGGEHMVEEGKGEGVILTLPVYL